MSLRYCGTDEWNKGGKKSAEAFITSLRSVLIYTTNTLIKEVCYSADNPSQYVDVLCTKDSIDSC